jgi:Glycosyltransferase Family 4
MLQDTQKPVETGEVIIGDFPLHRPSHQLAAPARIALVGGFTPRRCGIATFTADVRASLMAASPELAVDVYALTPADGLADFGSAVRAAISDHDPASFAAAAAMIEASCPDMVWLQHEFGLYGGEAGDMVFALVDRISVPLVITLHTVLAEPDAAQRAVMLRLIASAAQLVVMSQHSAGLLVSVYGADADHIVVIPHGAPDRPFGRTDSFKRKFGFAGRHVLMTFGLRLARDHRRSPQRALLHRGGDTSQSHRPRRRGLPRAASRAGQQPRRRRPYPLARRLRRDR